MINSIEYQNALNVLRTNVIYASADVVSHRVLSNNAVKEALETILNYDFNTSELYFEAHITIEPVFDAERALAAEIAKCFNFKLADLLMKKRSEDTEERSSKDTFMTGHSRSYSDLEQRMGECIKALQNVGFKVWRYKIEDTIIDSKRNDILNLIGR